MKHPGQIAKDYREKAGMTMPQLCAKLAERGIEVHKQQLYRWEKDGKMSALILMNLCDILEIPDVPKIFLYENAQECPAIEMPQLNSAGQHLQKMVNELLVESDRYRYTPVEVDPTRTIQQYYLAASAGTGQPDPGSGYDDVPRPLCAPEGDNVVIMKVAGMSMMPDYEDGDRIFVDKRTQYRNGDIVIVRRNDDIFVKKLVRVPGHPDVFESLSSDYGPVEYTEYDEVEIQGVVLGKV